MRLSGFTIIFSLYMVFSSFFMQEVWKTSQRLFGAENVNRILLALCLVAIAGPLSAHLKNRLSLKKIFLLIILSAWGLVFALRQPYISEKAHVLQFALLGWLATRDLSKSRRPLWQTITCAFLFAALVGVTEELYQKLLPWRVCDIRDMLTDSLGGLFGVIAFVLTKIKTPSLS